MERVDKYRYEEIKKYVVNFLVVMVLVILRDFRFL